MHWYLTLPFALGIFLSRLVLPELKWEFLLLVVGLLSMWFLYRRRANVLPLLLLNAFLLGLLYAQVRQSLSSDDGSPSSVLSQHVSFRSTSLCPEHQAVLSAMLLGDRSQLSSDQRRLYRNAGVSHLLALSGTHLGILLTIFGVLMLPCVRFSRWRWPVFTFILFLLWGYALAVGLPKSLLRASLMTTFFLLGQFSLRPTRGYEILGTSVLFMLLLDPLCAFDVGAQLSVVALVGITCFYPVLDNLLPSQDFHVFMGWERLLYSLLRFLFVSLSAWLFTLPLVVYYFCEFQPWQAFMGVVLIPVTSVVMYGGVLLLLVSACLGDTAIEFISSMQEFLMDVQESMLRFFASLPLASVKVSHLSLWHVALFYLVLAEMWVMLRYRSWKVLLLFLLAFVVSMCCLVSL